MATLNDSANTYNISSNKNINLSNSPASSQNDNGYIADSSLIATKSISKFDNNDVPFKDVDHNNLNLNFTASQPDNTSQNVLENKAHEPETGLDPIAQMQDPYVLTYKKFTKRPKLLGKDDLIKHLGLTDLYKEKVYPYVRNDNPKKLKKTIWPYVQDLPGYNIYRKDNFLKELIYGPDVDSVKPERVLKRTLKEVFYIEKTNDSTKPDFDMSVFGLNSEDEIKKGLRRAKKNFIKKLEAKKLEKKRLKQQQESENNKKLKAEPTTSIVPAAPNGNVIQDHK